MLKDANYLKNVSPKSAVQLPKLVAREIMIIMHSARRFSTSKLASAKATPGDLTLTAVI